MIPMYHFVVLLALALGGTNSVFVGRHYQTSDINFSDYLCATGPTVWCQNLTTAVGCNAFKHCLQTVWERRAPPNLTDDSPVCKTCLDMVQQAHDVVASPQMREQIFEVINGSCEFLKVNFLVNDCERLVDPYIDQIIDMIKVQLDPEVLCSIVGLCNDKAKEYKNTPQQSLKMPKTSFCTQCNRYVPLMKKKFQAMPRDNYLNNLLDLCAEASTYSDMFAIMVKEKFSEIYNMTENIFFDERSLCFLTGQCSEQYHTHKDLNVEITPESHVGYVDHSINIGDDLECDFCTQILEHIRDVVVRNTSEEEFVTIAEEVCSHLGSMSETCTDLVKEYSKEIFEILKSESDFKAVCAVVGICPKKLTESKPIENVPGPLPIELYTPHFMQTAYSGGKCLFCEYFMHFLQVELTEPDTSGILKKVCKIMPSEVQSECEIFIEENESVLQAYIAQKIDPSTFCPMLRMCPKVKNTDVDIFLDQTQETYECSLCLFAITDLCNVIKENKTEVAIKDALGKLCSHLSNNLIGECTTFVNTYSGYIIDGLVTNFTSQEVCTYIHVCSNNKSIVSTVQIEGGDIETNMIPDNTINGRPIVMAKPITKVQNSACNICEFAIQRIQHYLQDNTTEETVKNDLDKMCNMLPGKETEQECLTYVNQYYKIVIDVLTSSMTPHEICGMMNICSSNIGMDLNDKMMNCGLCNVVMETIKDSEDKVFAENKMKSVLLSTCKTYEKTDVECEQFFNKYTSVLFSIFQHVSGNQVCEVANICEKKKQHLVGGRKCTWGPSYWCTNKETAEECGTIDYCKEKFPEFSY